MEDSLHAKLNIVLKLIKPLENVIIIFSGISEKVQDLMVQEILDPDDWHLLRTRGIRRYICKDNGESIVVMTTESPHSLDSITHSFVLLQGNPHRKDIAYSNVHLHARKNAENLIYFKV